MNAVSDFYSKDAESGSDPSALDGSDLGDAPPRGKLLEHFLDDGVDLDQAFDRLVDAHDREKVDSGVLRSVLPGEALASGDMTLAVLLASILSEYEDIERLIGGLKEHEESADLAPSVPEDDAVAVVSEAELADPETLSQILEPLQERDRFELLFETAKAALDRLGIYELSQKPSAELVAVVRREGSLRTIQSLVNFLRSLNTAATTFEALDMPQPHVREYLKHLYLMGDWNEMSRLVSVLEVAVSQLIEEPAPVPVERVELPRV